MATNLRALADSLAAQADAVGKAIDGLEKCLSKRGPGRPARAEAAAMPFRVRLSPAEWQRVEEAAKANHQRPADFARDALVTAADDTLEA